MPNNVRFVVRNVKFAEDIIKRLKQPDEDIEAVPYSPNLADKLQDSLVFLERLPDEDDVLLKELIGRRIPAIVLTHVPIPEDTVRYFKMGARDYLTFSLNGIEEYRNDITAYL